MARGINKVILVGNLGRDPEIRYTENGVVVANITLATNESWKDKTTGEQQDKTEWHRIVFFNRLAEIVDEYLKKGAQIYVEGKLQTRKWQDQDGQDRYTTEVICNEMQMLGSRGGSGMTHDDMNDYQSKSASGSRVPYTGTAKPAAKAVDFKDDIPF